MAEHSATDYRGVSDSDDAAGITRDIRRHIVSTLGADYDRAEPFRVCHGLAMAVRDRLIDNWIRTQRSYYDRHAKRVYYLSMEFLPGRFLRNSIMSLGIEDAVREALQGFGMTLEAVAELEWDPGLGNGGLGRLASCYLDSMASLRIPGYGYGILYEYGIFFQVVQNGWQVERPDHWLRCGSPWVIARTESLFEVKFGGRVEQHTDASGRLRVSWVDTSNVMAMANDILVPGYRNGNTINMRLWSARSSRELDLESFSSGDYVGAIQDKLRSENISKVLYPSEAVRQGRELRLMQEYFFVAATFQDLMRRFAKRNLPFSLFPDRVAVQLNDTHPSIAVAELMRILVDEKGIEWDEAWDLTVRTFGYTNHTVLPEALETWPVEMMQGVLPRHVQIIYEINRRFLASVRQRFPGDEGRLARVSLIAEGSEPRIRMANLAVVGSHAVNGVSALHSKILKEQLFRDFAEVFPGRFMNRTNGITHRRFLLQANPRLAALITEAIGDGWISDLTELAKLRALADDSSFQERWRSVRQANKEGLASWLEESCGIVTLPDSMFDIQVKRFHEYKRQLLNVLHVITLYNRARRDPRSVAVPRSVMLGGKSAPSYTMAKLIIKLVGSVAAVIRRDSVANDVLRLDFLPNYCVSMAERLVPACDLSEQISTAGMEASGTGNMKFALNGALIIGTLDGANVEIMEEIGADNIFIFGHTAEEVQRLRQQGYNPRAVVDADPELAEVLQQIGDGTFSPGEPGLFRPILEALLDRGDYFQVLADFRSYVACQERVSEVYLDRTAWARRSIMSVAGMGHFSSDRAVREYVKDIWEVRPT